MFYEVRASDIGEVEPGLTVPGLCADERHGDGELEGEGRGEIVVTSKAQSYERQGDVFTVPGDVTGVGECVDGGTG